MASSFKSSSSSASTRSSQIQKNYNTYKANKAYKRQLKRAEKNEPIYRDAYRGYKDAIVNSLENGGFEFDAANSPVYSQYSKDYRLMGNVGANLSQENIEELSGGYGTTYSGTVAQQGLEGYLANEKNIMPSLYQVEKQNQQAEYANTVNKGNLYNTLEGQDFARYQDKVNFWKNNREYAYNKFLNDYQQSAVQHQKVKGTEISRQSSSGTTTSITGGSSKKYSNLKSDSVKTREGAMAYLANNGLDASNVMSKEQFQNENAKRRYDSYAGALLDPNDSAYDAEAKKKLDKDYSDYLLNYIRQAQGYEKKDWFSKTQKKIKR